MNQQETSGAPVFQRKVDYLRISITDRCNERCLYCMPEGLKYHKERDEVLTYEEILRTVRIAVGLGFRKFRVTGGEPLVRRGVLGFLRGLGACPGIESFGLSTNATLLAPMAQDLRDAGVQSVNISLDTLDAETYRRLTQWDIADCLAGIEAARRVGFPSIKLNAVMMRGTNDDQILPLVRFAAEIGAVVRFIELMPLSRTDLLSPETFFSVEEVRRRIESVMPLEQVSVKLGHGPAVYCRTSEGSLVGFIGAMSNLHFCDLCNKIRLTADGKIRPCLGDHLEFDLRGALRAGEDDEPVIAVFRRALGEKPPEHEFRRDYRPGRSMTAIGG